MTIFQFFMDMNNLKCQHGNHFSGFIIFISWDVENQPNIPIYIKIQQYKIHKAPLHSCIYLLILWVPLPDRAKKKKTPITQHSVVILGYVLNVFMLACANVLSTTLHLNLFTVWQDCLDSQLSGSDYLYRVTMPNFLHGWQRSDLTSHDCFASTLPTESSSHRLIFYYNPLASLINNSPS